MQIKEIYNKKDWEGFLESVSRKTFLQSWNWGEFQRLLGNKVFRYGIFNEEKLISVFLAVKHKAKRGTFLLVPHGPIVENSKSQITNPKSQMLHTLIDRLKELAKEEKADFIRVSPVWERTEENNEIFKESGFRLRPLHTHPESSWKLNIDKSEEELLKNMRKTTRYLIRQAEKNKDLKIIQSFDIKDVEVFSKMHLEVIRRQKFVPFSLGYFRKEFEAFAQDNQIALFLAYYKGKPIAASYGIFWSGIAFYHHAALLPEYKKIPAAYLLQWSAIREARKRGCKLYDFWGYENPVKKPKHPYSGPTLFKMGFGGKKYEYVKTQDLPLTFKYWFNYIVETARRIKRGL